MISVPTRLLSTFVGVAIALVLILAVNISDWVQVQPVAASSLVSLYSGNFYGARKDWMSTATNLWPQILNYYCGIANIQALIRYDFQKEGKVPVIYHQSDVAYQLNTSSALSPWGTPSGSVFKANISLDGGTDPRSIAWGAWRLTPKNYMYHNYIYSNGNTAATYSFARDFGSHSAEQPNIPISVTIDQGGHSFIVSGVYASSDPSSTHETIYDIVTWDPWLGPSNNPLPGYVPLYNTTQNQVWSLTDWLGNQESTHGHIWFLWSKPYSNTANGGFDPEPSAPGRYYDPPFPNGQKTHWAGYYITIEWDTIADGTMRNGVTITHDIALDQNRNPVAHN
jgi:hypothetical protein